MKGAQSPLWLAPGEPKTELLMPPPGIKIVTGPADFKRNRDSSKAPTALIITVNRQHDLAVEQAAPDAAEPRREAMSGLVPSLGGIKISHPFSPCVPIMEHFNGQSARVEPRLNRW